jgi:prefoldin alpha subunit
LEKKRVSSEDQETFRRLAVELRILEGTADAIQARLNFVGAALTELNLARMTLEGVEKETPDAPLFVPIGGGSYVKAKLESTDRVIVGMGAGVSIEKTMIEAKATVQNRISEFEKTRVSLQQQLVQVVGRIQENRNKLDDLAAKLSRAEKTTDVQ